MKERLNRLLDRVSGNRLARRLVLRRPTASVISARPVANVAGPKSVANRTSLKPGVKPVTNRGSPKPIADRAAAPPEGRTGWTVHRDVALRLKNISVAELGASPDDPGRELGAFKIRLAGTPQVRGDAGFLVQQRYARKGYGTSATQVSANVCTFAAYDEGRLAGTVSLRLDSAEGLAADEIYRRELDMLRDAGRSLCEFTRLAVDVSRFSKPVLAGLFHTVFLYATKVHNLDFAVIEVIPRHVAYYRNSLGFEAMGAERHNPRVNTAGVLMGMSFAEIAEHLHRHAGMATRARKTRSLYAYGFSQAEEAGILGRLRTLHAN